MCHDGHLDGLEEEPQGHTVLAAVVVVVVGACAGERDAVLAQELLLGVVVGDGLEDPEREQHVHQHIKASHELLMLYI